MSLSSLSGISILILKCLPDLKVVNTYGGMVFVIIVSFFFFTIASSLVNESFLLGFDLRLFSVLKGDQVG